MRQQKAQSNDDNFSGGRSEGANADDELTESAILRNWQEQAKKRKSDSDEFLMQSLRFKKTT